MYIYESQSQQDKTGSCIILRQLASSFELFWTILCAQPLCSTFVKTICLPDLFFFIQDGL